MPLSEAVRARIESWKSRLIDLSRANRLLCYRHHRASSVAIVEEDPGEILGLLAAGKKLTFDPRPEGSPPTAAGVALRTGDLRLQTDLPKDALAKLLQRLYRDGRSSLEEQGFNSLFVALGMLEFRMPGDPELWRAPLLLFPVQLVGRGARGDLALTAFDDETRINPALLVKLRLELGIEPALPETDEPPTYPTVRAAFAAATAGREGWRIVDELHLAPFSFAKIALYEDLVRHGDVIGSQPIVETLATGKAPAGADSAPAPDNPPGADHADEGVETCQILDADSSQEAALAAARRGESFVLQGPPGTGKSQTIANVIADALSVGKTVLFVSEKMAALEVVERRLAQAGLGDFCLELHSNKAKKVEVVRSLGAAWKRAAEAVAAVRGGGGDLGDVRAYLAQYAAELGAPRGAAGLSTHKILGEAARLAGVPEIPFAIPAPESVDGRALRSIHEFLRSATDVRRPVEPVGAHPWRGVRRTTLGVSTIDEVRRAANLVLAALGNLARAGVEVGVATSLEEPASIEGHERAAAALAHLVTTPKPPAAVLVGRTWVGWNERPTTALARAVERQAERATLLAAYESSVLSIDAATWLSRTRPGGSVFGWWRRRALRNDLRVHRKAGAAAQPFDAAHDLRSVLRVRELGAALEADGEVLRTAFGDAHPGLDGDWATLASHVAWVRRLLELWPAGQDLGAGARRIASGLDLDGPRGISTTHRRALEVVIARRDEFATMLQLDDTARLGATWRGVETTVLEREVEVMIAALDALPDWVGWQAERAKGATLGLRAYLDGFDGRDVDSRHLLNGWFRTYYRAFADRLLAEVPTLAGFQGRLHEAKVDRFRELDQRQKATNAARVTGALRAKAPSEALGSVTDSEVGVLTRQLAMQTRHMPTRRLFDRIPNLLRTLKPCLMMSPLSVATYLPPGGRRFDLVVFDEASQICPEDAIGALARGTQAIVAGDSRQLPPTKFFEARLVESDEAPEDALVDLESVLDDCASVLPRRKLLWHYRSQDESLISFSNENFYDGDLITFPNAVRDPSRLGISFVHVPDGIYDAGRSATNRREAEVIAARVFDLLEKRPGDSLGVVTFSTTQRDAVLDAIDARRRQNERFEARFSADALEPVFVKNLEAVQGDERDVILFGVGYGRDATGTFLHNFGPLNKDGGERRLNVAVSRARKQMIVFASILPDEIDPARVSKLGGKLLKVYLERARQGLAPEATRVAPDPETLGGLVRTVRAAIEAAGFPADVHVGESGFRIDLAVRDPAHGDRYALGVLCDGPASRETGTLTPRDGERIRHEVLTRLGWRVHRAWAPDWLRFPDREASRLRAAIDEGCRADASPTPRPATPRDCVSEASRTTLDASPDAGPRGRGAATASSAIPGVIDYVAARLRGGSPESFHEGPLERVTTAVAKLVDVEAPVHVDIAARRLAAAWGIERVTERVTARVEAAIAAAEGAGTIARRGDFLHAREARQVIARRPADGVERALEQVAPEELAEAMTRVVDACLGLSEDALRRETARVFGVQRPGERATAILTDGLATLLGTRRLARDAEGWIRLPERTPPRARDGLEGRSS